MSGRGFGLLRASRPLERLFEKSEKSAQIPLFALDRARYLCNTEVMETTAAAGSKVAAFIMGAGIIASMIRTIAASPVLATYPLTSIIGG